MAEQFGQSASMGNVGGPSTNGGGNRGALGGPKTNGGKPSGTINGMPVNPPRPKLPSILDVPDTSGGAAPAERWPLPISVTEGE